VKLFPFLDTVATAVLLLVTSPNVPLSEQVTLNVFVFGYDTLPLVTVVPLSLITVLPFAFSVVTLYSTFFALY
jgi:hypothetical protein